MTTTETLTSAETLTLIEGNFSPVEAKEILMNIFSTKINFHKIKNFSSQERYGIDDETAQKRILELILSVEKIKQVIAEAKESNRNLVITSQINIELAED